MHNKWVIFLVAVWIIGLLIGGITEKIYFSGQDMTILEAFFSFNFFNMLNPAWYIEWLGILAKMMTFDYGFLTSTWWGQIIRWLFIGIGLGIAIQLAIDIARIIRGT